MERVRFCTIAKDFLSSYTDVFESSTVLQKNVFLGVLAPFLLIYIPSIAIKAMCSIFKIAF